MIVRIGYAPGLNAAPDPARLADLVHGLDREGFDSLWVTERATGEIGDPVVTLSYAAALSSRLKLGTAVMVVPGRQPALLAQQLASLDRLCAGRLLPAVGLGRRGRPVRRSSASDAPPIHTSKPPAAGLGSTRSAS